MKVSLRGVRVACFYPWAPFEVTGAWVRFTCLWRYLVEAGADVTLAFLERGNDAELEGLSVRYLGEPNVYGNIGDYARAMLSGKAVSELKHYSATELNFLLMYEKGLVLSGAKAGPWVDAVIQEHDIVTCEYPMYAPMLSDFCRKWNRPLVVTSLDLLFELHGRHPGAKARLKQKEIQALGLADALVFCNEHEREIFAKEGLKGVTVLNTGDVLGVTPGGEERHSVGERTTLKIKTAHYCLFVGSAHAPNLEAADEVKRMAKSMPEMTFVVAGNCHAPVREGNFIAVGPVTDGFLDRLYRGAFAIVVPLLRGTGMSVKIFQAFTYEKAVVSTPEGARGHAIADGEEALLEPKPQDFPKSIRRLLADDELRRRIAKNARAYALRHDFRIHFEPYGEIIARLTNRSGDGERPAERRTSLVLVDNNLCDRVGHHFNYALALKEESLAQGFAFQALAKQTVTESVRSELSAVPTFSLGIHEESPSNPYPWEWGPLRATYDFLHSNDVFARELKAGLTRKVRPGDVIFLPNATPRQMLGLALLLLKHPIYLTLRFVLMLRYSVHLPSGPITDRKIALDKGSHDNYALAIDKLVAADVRSAVRLTTDSAELAQEFGAFTKRPIEVLPIPHTAHAPSSEWPVEIPVKQAGKRRVVYLGDAREEKGFEFLPTVVKACAVQPACSEVEFVFQAYISSHHHQRMGQVIEELARLKPPNVHLVRSSLSPDAYQALLGSADLVLLPYDAATYRARTSGPFVEAICADKPVVVPAKSWMSAQLGDSQAGATFVSGNVQDLSRAVTAALTNLPCHAMAAQKLGDQFRQYHEPRNFVHSLMKT